MVLMGFIPEDELERRRHERGDTGRGEVESSTVVMRASTPAGQGDQRCPAMFETIRGGGEGDDCSGGGGWEGWNTEARAAALACYLKPAPAAEQERH